MIRRSIRVRRSARNDVEYADNKLLKEQEDHLVERLAGALEYKSDIS